MILDESLFEAVQTGDVRGSYKKKELSDEQLFDKVFEKLQSKIIAKHYKVGTDGDNLYINARVVNKKLPNGRVVIKREFLTDKKDYEDIIKYLDEANVKYEFKDGVQGLRLSILLDKDNAKDVNMDALNRNVRVKNEAFNDSPCARERTVDELNELIANCTKEVKYNLDKGDEKEAAWYQKQIDLAKKELSKKEESFKVYHHIDNDENNKELISTEKTKEEAEEKVKEINVKTGDDASIIEEILSKEEIESGKDRWVKTKEDEKVWNSLSDEDKEFLVLSNDMGFWFDEIKGNEELEDRYEELRSKFSLSLKESSEKLFTVELYDNSGAEPTRERFDSWEKAAEFAKTKTDGSVEEIYITKAGINGPSILNHWHRKWYTDLDEGFAIIRTIEDAQREVDEQIEKFGRIGGGLYDDLDAAGFYVDENNKVQYKVKPVKEDLLTNRNEYQIQLNLLQNLYEKDQITEKAFNEKVKELKSKYNIKEELEENITKLKETYTIIKSVDEIDNKLKEFKKNIDNSIKTELPNARYDLDPMEMNLPNNDKIAIGLTKDNLFTVSITKNNKESIQKFKTLKGARNYIFNEFPTIDTITSKLNKESARENPDKFIKVEESLKEDWRFIDKIDNVKIKVNLSDNGFYLFDETSEDENDYIDGGYKTYREAESAAKKLNKELKEELSPEQEKEYGLTTMINSLIKDELEAIDEYNSAIVTLEAENKGEFTDVIRDIISEENTHIGQLQAILKELNPSTTADIDEGQKEGQEQIDQAVGVTKGDTEETTTTIDTEEGVIKTYKLDNIEKMEEK